MKQYKLIIAYDGTDFSGWIQQPGLPTIVNTLESTFHEVYKKPISILGASKTDAGVHAVGQVAVFKTDLDLDAKTMQWAWNNALPESISLRSLEYVPDFHPHYNVINKTYYYHLFPDRPSPFFSRSGWHYA